VRDWQSRQVILERNLFNVSTLAPGPPVDEQVDLEATKLPLRLLGTAAVGDPARSWAAVEDQESREHSVVRIGDTLRGTATVERIERRRLVLRNAGRLEELALAEDEDGAPAAKGRRRVAARGRSDPRRSARSRAAAERVKRLAENRFRVDRTAAAEVADNPASLFSQARILPKYTDGEMVGVQLNAIKAGSLFEQIGIQNGDTITEFNGIRITNQQDSAAVLRELTQATDFQVTVSGADGEERHLTYEVR
jgi:general secretion pathway protein C